MINLIRLQFVKKLYEVYRVAEVPVMQKQSHAVHVGISIKMIDTRSVKGAGSANDAVDFIALLKQQIRQITSVLAGNAGDQGPLHLRHNCRAFPRNATEISD